MASGPEYADIGQFTASAELSALEPNTDAQGSIESQGDLEDQLRSAIYESIGVHPKSSQPHAQGKQQTNQPGDGKRNPEDARQLGHVRSLFGVLAHFAGQVRFAFETDTP